MRIEDRFFEKYKLIISKLIPYGFKLKDGLYIFSKDIMNGDFRVDIVIDVTGKVKGKVFDVEINEEYFNIHIEKIMGEFVNKIKKEYVNILQDIAENCFEKEYFYFNQTNRITKKIQEKYQVIPEFLWSISPDAGVFRHKDSGKWFGLITKIDQLKIVSNKSGKVEVLNLKLDFEVPEYLKLEGIYPAYHMNKKNWVSIILDETLKDEKILYLLEKSFANTV